MRKIPTLFQRNSSDARHVTPTVHPACQWVIDGEGLATRKYDGTCVMHDGTDWWARREVRPGKTAPVGFREIERDERTGKAVGWEPIDLSPFFAYWREALEAERDPLYRPPVGTYELIGPKINGNPERVEHHQLIRHFWAETIHDAPRDFEGLRGWLAEHPDLEGIVWHHPDGRMAKLKRRDFPPAG